MVLHPVPHPHPHLPASGPASAPASARIRSRIRTRICPHLHLCRTKPAAREHWGAGILRAQVSAHDRSGCSWRHMHAPRQLPRRVTCVTRSIWRGERAVKAQERERPGARQSASHGIPSTHRGVPRTRNGQEGCMCGTAMYSFRSMPKLHGCLLRVADGAASGERAAGLNRTEFRKTLAA